VLLPPETTNSGMFCDVRIWTAKRVKEVRDALAKYSDEVRELSTLRG